MTTSNPEQDPNIFQKIASATHDIVTPANLIDAVAFGVAMKYMSKLDTTKGVGMVAGSFLADVVDGTVARATGTASAFGAKVDAGGDKIKIASGLYHIHRLDLASPALLATVGLYNASNAGAVIYDKKFNQNPGMEVSKDGKYSVFASCMGIGLQVIGSHLETHDKPKLGQFAKTAGAGIAVGGIAKWGLPATKGYWAKALS